MKVLKNLSSIIRNTSQVWRKSLLFDYFGEPAYYFSHKFNGDTNFMVMAGVHPQEEAGIYALGCLLSQNNIPHSDKLQEMFVIPCRNTLGFHIQSIYEKSKNQIVDDNPYFTMIQSIHCELVLVIAKMNGRLPFGNFEWWAALKKRLSEYHSKLLMHVVIFSHSLNRTMRGNSYIFYENQFYDFNAGFGVHPWKHITELTSVINKANPQIIIDLHEGLGHGFYLYADPKNSFALQAGKVIISNMRQAGWSINNHVRFRELVCDGIYDQTSLQKKGSVNDVISQNTIFLVFETGIDLHLEERVKCHLDALKFAIIYANMKND